MAPSASDVFLSYFVLPLISGFIKFTVIGLPYAFLVHCSGGEEASAIGMVATVLFRLTAGYCIVRKIRQRVASWWWRLLLIFLMTGPGSAFGTFIWGLAFSLIKEFTITVGLFNMFVFNVAQLCASLVCMYFVWKRVKQSPVNLPSVDNPDQLDLPDDEDDHDLFFV